MKLTYRGTQYDYTPVPIETQPIDQVGKYRGVDIRFRTVTKPQVYPLQVQMLYRGVPYTLGEAAIGESTTTQPAIASAEGMVNTRLRAIAFTGEHKRQRREQSMLLRLEKALGIH